MLYQICNGTVRFGAQTILEEVNFEIRDKENIAIVGRNGCGKTTLLKLVAGEVDLSKRDSDENIFIAKAGNPTIGYLKQMAFDDEKVTLDAEIRKIFAPIIELKKEVDERLRVMEEDPSEINIKRYTTVHDRFTDMGGYNYEREYAIMYSQFGFAKEDRYKLLSEFSGGQKTRIAFVKLLLSQPDILLLDEPTNHLDISTIEWLEDYLRNYPKAVVIVSHDRMFLDKVVDVVYEIEYGKTTRYAGNYSDFMVRKKENWEKQFKDYKFQQKEIDRLEGIVERFKGKPTKVSMAKSKQKAIEHMDKIEAPEDFDLHTFHVDFTPEIESGREILSVDDLQIGYDRVISKINCKVMRGKKIGIIGDNGTGKSTFLKTIVDIIPALDGNYTYGHNVTVGYFDQQSAQYSSNKTVLDEFWDEFPGLTQTQVRNHLGAFLFTQDEVFKYVNMLSGGERARLALAKMFKRKPNFLILDEPTNHMDIVGKETLENILNDYPGTVLFVSHDRYFIKQVSNELLVFEKGTTEASNNIKNDLNIGFETSSMATTKFFQFGYEQYEQDKQRNKEQLSLQKNTTNTIEQKKEKPVSKEKEKMLFDKEIAKKQRRIEKIEKLITDIEQEIEELKEELTKPEYVSDYIKLGEINSQIESKENEINSLIEEWDELSVQIEG